MFLGGGNSAVRNVMGLGTAQRNVSAAIVVAAQNFSEGNTLVFILVASIFLLLILLPIAKRMGRHSEAAAGEMAAGEAAT
jgi:BASS family bile acid:Na+ symporter